jgi:hypothetical protein
MCPNQGMNRLQVYSGLEYEWTVYASQIYELSLHKV